MDIFAKYFDQERHCTKTSEKRNNFKSMTMATAHNRNLSAPQRATETSAATLEYIAAMEERAEMVDTRIKELESCGDHVVTGSTTNTTTASTITGSSGRSSRSSISKVERQMTEIQTPMTAMAASISAQSAVMTALSKKVASGGSGGRVRCNRDKQTNSKTEKYECPKCKQFVWHKRSGYPEYEYNKHKC